MSELTVRVAKVEDAEEILNIYAYYVRDTAITFEYEVPFLEDFQGRIRGTLQRYPYLVACKDGKIVGYAYAGAFKERAAYDWAVEMTVYVDKSQKKQGIGRMLYRELEKALYRQNILNVNACIACPVGEDAHLTADSIFFHERMGYSMVGKFHRCGYKFDTWYDMVWMEKFLGEHPEHPQNVILFSNGVVL